MQACELMWLNCRTLWLHHSGYNKSQQRAQASGSSWMDIDAKLDKSLDELIKSSPKPRKPETTIRKSAPKQPVAARPTLAQVRMLFGSLGCPVPRTRLSVRASNDTVQQAAYVGNHIVLQGEKVGRRERRKGGSGTALGARTTVLKIKCGPCSACPSLLSAFDHLSVRCTLSVLRDSALTIVLRDTVRDPAWHRRAPEQRVAASGGRGATQPAAAGNEAAGRKKRRARERNKKTAQLSVSKLPPKRQQQQQQSRQRQRGGAAIGAAAPSKGIVVTLQNEYYQPVVRIKEPSPKPTERLRRCGCLAKRPNS